MKYPFITAIVIKENGHGRYLLTVAIDYYKIEDARTRRDYESPEAALTSARELIHETTNPKETK